VYSLLLVALVAGFLIVSLAARRLVIAIGGPTAADGLLDETLAALIVALLAYPARGWLQGALDRALYRDRLARRPVLAEAVGVLDHALPPGAVAAFLTDVVPLRIELAGAWLLLPPTTIAAAGASTASRLPGPVDPVLQELKDVDGPVVLALGDDLSASHVPTLPAEAD